MGSNLITTGINSECIYTPPFAGFGSGGCQSLSLYTTGCKKINNLDDEIENAGKSERKSEKHNINY